MAKNFFCKIWETLRGQEKCRGEDYRAKSWYGMNRFIQLEFVNRTVRNSVWYEKFSGQLDQHSSGSKTFTLKNGSFSV